MENVFSEFCSMNINNVEWYNNRIRLNYWEVDVFEDEDEEATYSFQEWQGKYIIKRNEEFYGVAEVEIEDSNGKIVTEDSYSGNYNNDLTIYVSWCNNEDIDKLIVKDVQERWVDELDALCEYWKNNYDEYKDCDFPDIADWQKLKQEFIEENKNNYDDVNMEDYFSGSYNNFADADVTFEQEDFFQRVENSRR